MINPVTLSSLEIFPRQLEALFYSIPQSHINWTPSSWEGIPSEAFTAIEQICHVRDIEIDGYHIRLNRMLNEIHPTLDSVDGDALIIERGYAESDPTSVFSTFRQARLETLQLIQHLSDDQLKRSGYFEGYGNLTVLSLIHYLSSHDYQHLSGLQWLLGKIRSSS